MGLEDGLSQQDGGQCQASVSFKLPRNLTALRAESFGFAELRFWPFVDRVRRSSSPAADFHNRLFDRTRDQMYGAA